MDGSPFERMEFPSLKGLTSSLKGKISLHLIFGGMPSPFYGPRRRGDISKGGDFPSPLKIEQYFFPGTFF
jgi:hypothetical protein